LVAPSYFGYDSDIKHELERQGASVDLISDRPFKSPFMKAVIRFRPELLVRSAERFFQEQLHRLAAASYDLVLVVQGESVTARTLKLMRSAYPRARLVFYSWDSLQNKPFAKKNLAMYDACFTFDPVDATRYGMGFRPLFFTADFEREAPSEFEFELSFIGTIHSDRYRIVDRLANELPDRRVYRYLYLQAPWMFWARKLFTKTIDGATRADFSFQPLGKDVVRKVFFKSRAVIDIEHPGQRGLTMRTIEALGSGTKLITTNHHVKDYDFYDAGNVCVIDRREVHVDRSFFEAPYKRVPEPVYDRYRLENWVNEVCGRMASCPVPGPV
jgi:hypothetical protein